MGVAVMGLAVATASVKDASAAENSSSLAASCGVAPVDAQATAQAQNLLCYQYSQYGNHIISGQQESTWVSGADYEMNYIHGISGKYPAIRGQDMGDSPDFGARRLAWWNAGGGQLPGGGVAGSVGRCAGRRSSDEIGAAKRGHPGRLRRLADALH
jgi:hypothetical protein